MADHLLKLLICLVIVMNTHHVLGHVQIGPDPVRMTLVKNAEEKGAVCNDGSPAAYYYAPGFGDGVNNWFIYTLGGGWCNTDKDCLSRLTLPSGSSRYNNETTYFEQNYSRNQTKNPDFYNWNRVEVVYCDSSSLMGEVDHPNIYGRGARIFDALIEELSEKGLRNATNAILSGGSAGGLAALLHCDDFRALLPETSRVKCISDSGFFLHAPQLYGGRRRTRFFAHVAAYHGFTDKLPASCSSRMNASLCMFPQYMITDVKTPIFLVETKFDAYQMPAREYSDEPVSFTECIWNLTVCTPSHFETMKTYGKALTETLLEIRKWSSVQMFVHPCFRHGHFYEPLGWEESYKLKNKTIAQAVGDWFYDRSSSFQEIDLDHDYPLARNCTKLPNAPKCQKYPIRNIGR